MILRIEWWSTVREQFTDDEKAALNGAVTGQSICPRGPIVDLEKLSTELREKVSLKLAGVLAIGDRVRYRTNGMRGVIVGQDPANPRPGNFIVAWENKLKMPCLGANLEREVADGE